MAAAESLPARQIVRSRFENAEYARTVHRVTVEEGTTIDDVLKPAFWAGVAGDMKRFDRIELIGDEETFFAELIVRDVGRGYARVALLTKVDFSEPVDLNADTDDFSVLYKGPKLRHIVVRKSDGAMLKDGIPTKLEALQWVEDHQRANAL